MALASEHHVDVAGTKLGDERAEKIRRQVAVCVDETQVVPAALGEPDSERLALARVTGELDPPHTAVLGSPFERLEGGTHFRRSIRRKPR